MAPPKPLADKPETSQATWGSTTGGHTLQPRRDATAGATAPRDRWVAIIEDHESMRSSLARIMRMEGIRAAVFASAEQFLDHPAPTSPSCLVVDMQLPGMSGVELAQLLERERPPLPPTIFISAHEDLLASPEGRRIALGRLGKPFEVGALLALVKPLL
jgi:FixJ family two-component response regulator